MFGYQSGVGNIIADLYAPGIQDIEKGAFGYFFKMLTEDIIQGLAFAPLRGTLPRQAGQGFNQAVLQGQALLADAFFQSLFHRDELIVISRCSKRL